MSPSAPVPLSLRLERDTALIDLAEPDTLNGIHAGNLEVFPRLVDEAGADPAATFLVVRGTARHFCTGGAATFLAELSDMDLEARVERLTTGQGWVNSLLRSPCMTIAAVEGLVAGAGVDVLLGFDVVLLAPGARINFFYNRLGAVPDLGGLWLLAERVGYARALAFYAGSAGWDAAAAAAAGVGEATQDAFPDTPGGWSVRLGRRYPIDRHAWSIAKHSLNGERLAALAGHQAKMARAQAQIFGTEAFRQRLQRVAAVRRLATT